MGRTFQSVIKMMTPEISVIVPIYGVENYIARCAESLFNQTMTDNVEFLFINDSTKDNSIEVLQNIISKHPRLKPQTKIISHSENKGLPAARNTGLAMAKGKYVVHVDGDDFAEPQMLEYLYKAVTENNADFAWCDYYITFNNKKRVISQPFFATPMDVVRGMLRGSMKYNVWNKICRLSLYRDNNIRFPEGYAMGEDLTMIMVSLHAQRCVYVNKILYNYVQNDGQMTAAFDERKLASLRFNCDRLQHYIKSKFPDLGLESENAALCQLMKWPFLLDGKLSSYRRWHEWFPESNRLIWQTKGVNFRIKFIEWCAAKHLLPVVWLHYLFVIKFYYGIVYRK